MYLSLPLFWTAGHLAFPVCSFSIGLRQGVHCHGRSRWPTTKVFCHRTFTLVMGEGYIQRADLQRLKEVFSKYASVTEGGEKFLTYEDFVVRFLKLLPEKDYNKETLALFGGILDQVLHEMSYLILSRTRARTEPSSSRSTSLSPLRRTFASRMLFTGRRFSSLTGKAKYPILFLP